jgi:hypothetical protein
VPFKDRRGFFIRSTGKPASCTLMSHLALVVVASLLFTGLAYAQTTSNTARTASSTGAEISPLDAHNLTVARSLVKTGALNLALDYLQRHPPTVASTVIWEAWAEQKWSILVLQEDWYALKQDAHGLPASFGGAKYFAIPSEARAMIALGELSAARQLLQPTLLVNDLPTHNQKAIREQLIALYRAQGDYINAKIEAIRFHDEFKPQNADWFIQRAVIEYLANDAAGASQLLAPIASIEAKLLQAYFRLRAGEIDAATAQLLIHRQLGRKRITPTEKKLAYALKASLIQTEDEAGRIDKIRALEQYLVIRQADLHPDVVSHNTEDLKTAYIDLSDILINTALMNPGRLSLKFKLAQQADQSGQATKARAVYADVLLDPGDVVLAPAAKNAFVSNLIQAEQYVLLSQLLGTRKVMGSFENVDSTASAKILNYALEQGDSDLILAIAPVLGAAPENIDSRDWLLQKARVDIFAGRFVQARHKIEDWIEQGGTLSGQEVDRVLQPVFDLQAVQQNDISLILFDQISDNTNSKRHKREILFWKAQSHDAKEERLTAAQLYLRSAMVEANGFDQWGQSARYHAAYTLMEAGAYFDARRLFDALLLVADDPARRATIKQALQRLWLLENQLGG